MALSKQKITSTHFTLGRQILDDGAPITIPGGPALPDEPTATEDP